MYDAGTQVRVRATVTDADTGAAIDPEEVAWTVYDPAGVPTSQQGSQDGTGSYSMLFVPTVGGAWTAAFVGTNPDIVGQRKIIVNAVPLR